ncbi:MAG TPA: TonB-dependent receptor, partial [Bryobacteraceae bacterium]|nr:TonB-dependent receptor [Bryobacteraceae bacterium]
SNLPVSRTMFPGNIIPQSRFDPAYNKILQTYPATNQPIKTGTFPGNDFYYTTPGKWITDQGDGRVDYRLSEKDSLFGSLSWSNTSKTDGAPFPGALDGTPYNGAAETDLSRNGQISYTRVWSPSLISESRIGFTRLVTGRVGADPTTNAFQQFGIGGYNPFGNQANNGGLPPMAYSNGYTTVGTVNWIPITEYNNVWDFIQNVSLIKGKHTLKFGAEFRPIQFPFYSGPTPRGSITYSNSETAFPSNQKGSSGATFSSVTGDPVASALLGQIDSGAISTTNPVSSRRVAYAFYAQDDWKVTPKLTLNLGMRYELWSPIYEQFARQSNFDLQNEALSIPSGPNQNAALPPNFATLFPNVTVSRGKVPNALIPWDKADFGPRIGIAYQVTPKTVVRLGFGIFYGGEENQGGSPSRGEAIPFNEQVNLSRTQGVSSFIGVSDPACPGCDWFSGGLSGGFPISPFTLPAGVSMRGVQTDFENPLVQKWNAVVQRELPGDMSLEVGY